uniref:BZIP domain-containing protein n=1 Tax=Bionectria ochroleuca TaxID=29856 RepID=A0A8H7KF92_BIOOC
MEATQEADSIRERKERKKVQNRLNQRARRSRLKEDKTDKKADRPYEVDRWRLHYSNGEATEKKQQQQLVVRKARPDAADDDEPPRARMRAAAAPIFGPFADHPVDVSVCICSGRAAIIKTYSASVSADHLLELIQFNVFRALVANKYSMSGKAQHYQEAAAADGVLSCRTWSRRTRATPSSCPCRRGSCPSRCCRRSCRSRCGTRRGSTCCRSRGCATTSSGRSTSSTMPSWSTM